MKKIILNADDFGMNAGINHTILGLAKEGLLSGTSVMMERVCKGNIDDIYMLKKLWLEKKISVGLHVEFFSSEYEKLFTRQYDHFVNIFGCNPDYLDLHMPNGEFINNGAAEYVQSIAIKKGLKYKNNAVDKFNIPDTSKTTIISFLNSTRMEFTDILTWIESVSDIGEICVHPGPIDEYSVSSITKLGFRSRDHDRVRKLNKLQQNYGFQVIK